jgi:pSer/pThr/pTyr-binding forkhead associated (FHA) protein
MKRKTSIGMDKTQPALLVQHGNTAQKHRPIDRAAVALGQARGCDIELDAPEVSSIHCIISRGPDGVYIRDCNSRMGTRINGERIKECYLHDADVLQVGPFSFLVYVPPSFATQLEKGPSMTATGPSTDARPAPSAQMDPSLATKEAELNQLEESLQSQQQDLERQRQELEEGAKQLENSRRAMNDESGKLQAHAQNWEKELNERQAKLDSDIQARLQECQRKCEEMEQAAAGKQSATPATVAPDSAVSPNQNRALEIRQQELDKFAKHLQTLQQKLREQEEKLRHGIVSDPTPAKVEIPEEFKQGQQEILGQVAQQGVTLDQFQRNLQRHHDELLGALGELNSLQKSTRDQQNQGMEMMRYANQVLQALAARRDTPPGPAALPPIPEPPPTPPGPEPKGRDKLSERLRAIDAKIPAVGSRQSRHD